LTYFHFKEGQVGVADFALKLQKERMAYLSSSERNPELDKFLSRIITAENDNEKTIKWSKDSIQIVKDKLN